MFLQVTFLWAHMQGRHRQGSTIFGRILSFDRTYKRTGFDHEDAINCGKQSKADETEELAS